MCTIFQILKTFWKIILKAKGLDRDMDRWDV